MIYSEPEAVSREIAHIKDEIRQEQEWVDELKQSVEDLKKTKDRMGVGNFCERRIKAGQERIKDLETDLSHLETLQDQ